MSEPGSGGGNLDVILATAEHDRKRLNSNALGPFSLTLLGVASVVGAGISSSPATPPPTAPGRQS